jgi:hypothetical protein
MRTSLREAQDIRGIVEQCPTLEMLNGIGKWMRHAAQEETTQIDFRFDVEEGSLRMSLWRLVSPVHGFLTAGRVAPEGMMYRGRHSSTAKYYYSYRDGWQESTDGMQYSYYPWAFFRGEHTGDICNVCRAYLAMRCMDIPTSNSASIRAGFEVQWTSRAGRTSHWRCGNCDGAPCRFEGCTKYTY